MAMFAAFDAQDKERMLALVDRDVVIDGGPLVERTGRSAAYRGHEGISELLDDLAKMWEELQVTPREYRHLGGGVLVTATIAAHAQGQMLTGSVAWVYRIRRRKVVSIEVFRSGAEALTRLGES